ncbi:iron exporter MbfA [Methylobacterium oryzihabitans]|uniref:Rubrerythrin n=1 Tax=Methylobacterium oryzihabitans TaxID=2499852 RepID=A0A3S2YPX1_9HYPH|nr:ferritin family protein [Methylobacterium oryzihabitans]RVU16639.1 rubrerythrin [Methylobacterium oryzihabitans]
MPGLTDLGEREVLALAIASEEEDSRIYQTFADDLGAEFPGSAALFAGMAAEERGHRDALAAAYRARFGEHLPPIRREDVSGFPRRHSLWWAGLDLAGMRREAEAMEARNAAFYDRAASLSRDLGIRDLYLGLAAAERDHGRRAGDLAALHLTEAATASEAQAQSRLFVLRYVQPGLAGLIDGSVSTLAPLFAAAFATHNNGQTFLVGLAASVGAGISMGFTEALSDDGSITGRGSPAMRGLVCGAMTALGGLGHTLPYLVPDSWPNAFWIATVLAALVVAVELLVISTIRTRYMETPFWRATLQVVLGGALVLLAGVAIGSA